MKTWVRLGAVLMGLGGVAAGCAANEDSNVGTGSTCGNLTCEPGETTATCPADCSGACDGGQCGNCASAHDCDDGAQRCDGTALQSCSLGADGCRHWLVTTDCAAEGGSCTEAGDTPACIQGCTDACDSDGETQCNGDAVETCTTGASGCLVWEQTGDCAAESKSCDATSGPAQCVAECVDQCPTWGATQCSGNVLQTCLQDSNDCQQWSTTTDCFATGKECLVDQGKAACAGGCTSKCAAEGNQLCLNGNVTECKKQANNCLDWEEVKVCGAGYLCKQNLTAAACEPDCSNTCPTVGAKQCKWNQIELCKTKPNTCQEWAIDSTCPAGQTCGTGSVCVTAPSTGEDCGSSIALNKGANTVNWTATKNDHLSPAPSCAASTLTGPDLVMRYKATQTGLLRISIDKPANNRWVMTSSEVCSDLSAPLFCASEYTNPSLAGQFNVTAGKDYYLLVSDTTSGTATLNNPLNVQVTELNCATYAAAVTPVSPTPGSTVSTLTPSIVINFEISVIDYVGKVTVSGNKGSNFSYDLQMTPPQVSFSADDKTMTVKPPALQSGELVTVTISGIKDTICFKDTAPLANYTFTVN